MSKFFIYAQGQVLFGTMVLEIYPSHSRFSSQKDGDLRRRKESKSINVQNRKPLKKTVYIVLAKLVPFSQ